jgi:hypothetical protein
MYCFKGLKMYVCSTKNNDQIQIQLNNNSELQANFLDVARRIMVRACRNRTEKEDFRFRKGIS